MSEDQTRDEALLEIIMRSKSRLVKHTKVLERMLRSVGSHGSNQLNTPQTTFPGDKAESMQDIELLGKYCDTTHESYMRLCKHRLKQLKELILRISLSTTPSDSQDLASLTKLAYQVRRSCSFKQLVAYNIGKSEKPGAAVPDLRDLVERFGQISKFYRAAITLTAFLAKLQKLGKGVEIKATSTEKIEISELAFRTAAQVRRRGGNHFTSSGGAQIQNMMNRWPAYREHVELQLIIFYEQNHSLTLFSPYIGCNKQSCYLCYNFIAEHGRFEVDGCHQSLYSLWTVRETISFADEERAGVFKRALKKLHFDLEQKIEAQRQPHWRRLGFSTHNESVANLSRVSLAFSDRTIQEPCSEKRTDDTVAIPAEGGFGVNPFKESSFESSMADLTPVPEESPEEITETGEPSRSDAVLPDESVDIAHGTSYSEEKRDVVAPQPRSHTEPLAPTASTQADPVPAQSLPSISVAWPVTDASAIDCSEDALRESQELRVPDQPRRKRRQRNRKGHQSRHPRLLQHDPRASRRSNGDEGSTIDKAVTKKRGNKPTTTPDQRKSQSSRPRSMHDRGRKRRSSLKQRLNGIIKVLLAAFGGLERRKPRHKEKSILRGKRIA
jgi:hypothetical protein